MTLEGDDPETRSEGMQSLAYCQARISCPHLMGGRPDAAPEPVGAVGAHRSPYTFSSLYAVAV